MCGIVACLSFDRTASVDVETVRRMTDTLVHRGPDDQGVWTDGPVGLGHRRLSIQDLSAAGRGPMQSADGQLVISFNGEIYNFLELRSELEKLGHWFRTGTDTEVALYAYREWGTEALQRFNGMFAFALWDKRRRRLFVARDRFGVKPLVYYQDNERFLCGSELKAILADRTVPRELDPVSLHHYFSLMSIPTPFTVYRGIKKLRAGHYLLVENGRVQERPWWKLGFVDTDGATESEILENIESLLMDSVRLRQISDAPLGAFLSGGVDSSVACALAKLSSSSLRTFSVAFAGNEWHDEGPYALKVAKHIGSTHTEIDLQPDFLSMLEKVVDHYDEPFSTPSSLAIYAMAQETVRHVKVVLTGDGGDEVFGGYSYRHTVPDERFDRLNKLPLSAIRSIRSQNPVPPVTWRMPNWLRRAYQLGIALTTPDETIRVWRYLQMFLYFNEREKFLLYTPEWAEHLRSQAGFSSTYDYLYDHLPANAPNRLARWLAFDLRTQLEYEMLAKVDKATMAWGLEARNPFLDYRLVQYVVGLPHQLMARGREGKILLKRIGEKLVPHDVLYRPKHGFNVPIDNWFRGPLPAPIGEAMSPEMTDRQGILRADTVGKVIDRHRQDKSVDLAFPIFTLAWFQMWLAQQEDPPSIHRRTL
ncbi:MAG: asparagine synthase (glutamine-hydrolyzing) [Gammaproteobacteria bacterium]|nr:asparagine synthase (glutamine-hydrolyzing) [Gammaproteobacteria bacterium]